MQTSVIPHIFPSELATSKSSGKIIWLYGLSGAGKSTIAQEAQLILKSYKKSCFILDGDDLRTGLNSDLDFTEQGREENLRRAAEVAILLSRTCDVVICTFITPKLSYRELVEDIFENHNTQLACINTPLSECEKRDTKGLYKKARNGEVQYFTGISSPYDFPTDEAININTMNHTAYESAINLLKQCNLIL
ncbi:MAG: adenylyl-sulfate kinase [Oceanospirillaceae bacterium]|nr:adenylyl-sulfate kinase [Oceanospirillaceae bacterium]